jgi:predicted dehydrogenase
MNVLLVGAGPMAVAYAKALRAQAVPFEAVGRGQRSAAAFAEAVGSRPIEGGLEVYLAKNTIEGARPVIVALPIPQLATAAKQLVAGGARYILVEKPAGLNLDEIASVEAVAAKSGARIFVAYNRRFYASVDAARRIIAEDGGVSSFHLDFSEIADRIATPDKDPAVLANWLLANSSHMFDLVFHLAGEPKEMNGAVKGILRWHPAGAVFTGHGRTVSGALFTWHADWTSAGRWGLDLRTTRRRVLLQPVETLLVQDKNSFSLQPVEIDDQMDRAFKPGIYRQVQAFLSETKATSLLPTIFLHAATTRRWVSGLFGCETGSLLSVGRTS